MTKAEILSTLLAASLVLAAFLGYNNYVLQSENLRLKGEIQDLSESKNALEVKYAELQDMHHMLLDEHKALNQSYYRLNETFYTFVQNYTTLSAEYEKTLTNYTNFVVAYDVLNQTYNTLLSAYQKALADYVDLTIAYASINQTYYALLENYTQLEQEAAKYTVLLSEYQKLTQRYQSLLANYTLLKDEYDELYFALYKPLLSRDKVIPTISELEQWLSEDKTDELYYTSPDFVCGDYAVMLHMHAKMKRWDMGVVAVLGSLGGREFNHAFNAIICQEGLVYVEPQNDAIFSGPIGKGVTYYHPRFGWVRVSEFIIVILYDSV